MMIRLHPGYQSFGVRTISLSNIPELKVVYVSIETSKIHHDLLGVGKAGFLISEPVKCQNLIGGQIYMRWQYVYTLCKQTMEPASVHNLGEIGQAAVIHTYRPLSGLTKGIG